MRAINSVPFNQQQFNYSLQCFVITQIAISIYKFIYIVIVIPGDGNSIGASICTWRTSVYGALKKTGYYQLGIFGELLENHS